MVPDLPAGIGRIDERLLLEGPAVTPLIGTGLSDAENSMLSGGDLIRPSQVHGHAEQPELAAVADQAEVAHAPVQATALHGAEDLLDLAT